MNSKTILLTGLLFTGASLTVQARLGETLEQLQARLGAPAPNPGDARVLVNAKWYPFGQIFDFAKEGWSVECVMIDGKCGKITYVKNAPFTDDDLKTILTNEAEGSTWKQSISSTSVIDSVFLPTMKVREWTRADGATAQTVDKSFTLTDPSYTHAADAATAKGNKEAEKKMPNL